MHAIRQQGRPFALAKFVETRFWRPGHARLLVTHRRPQRPPGEAPSEDRQLSAAAAWLRRAQDATTDGGVVGRYRLDRGWTTSYPEITGYLIPTFLELAKRHDESFRGRAARAAEFLLAIQLDSGAFASHEIGNPRMAPSPFNTAQIINGLLGWYESVGDAEYLRAARRAGDWLVDIQDDDGGYRRFFYRNTPATYSAHISCWMADLWTHCPEIRYRDSVARHIDWLVAQHDPSSGWFDKCSFRVDIHARGIADLHTLGYTLAGLLHSAERLERQDAVDAVTQTARRVSACVTEDGWLPGVLDREWNSASNSSCLTGNAQMALVWLRLYERSRDETWLAPALRILEFLGHCQIRNPRCPDLNGGFSGSVPLFGAYLPGILPVWAAKFFVDALLRKQAVIPAAQLGSV